MEVKDIFKAQMGSWLHRCTPVLRLSQQHSTHVQFVLHTHEHRERSISHCRESRDREERGPNSVALGPFPTPGDHVE